MGSGRHSKRNDPGAAEILWAQYVAKRWKQICVKCGPVGASFVSPWRANVWERYTLLIVVVIDFTWCQTGSIPQPPKHGLPHAMKIALSAMCLVRLTFEGLVNLGLSSVVREPVLQCSSGAFLIVHPYNSKSLQSYVYCPSIGAHTLDPWRV